MHLEHVFSARAHKELQRRKNALESSSLPTKLSDCRSDDTGAHRTLYR
jgi:DNA gyrase subunit B